MGQKTATWEMFVLVSNIPPGKGARNQGGSSHTKWEITTAKDPGVWIRESIRSPNHQHCPKLEVTSAWPWPSIKGRHLHTNEELVWVRVLFFPRSCILESSDSFTCTLHGWQNHISIAPYHCWPCWVAQGQCASGSWALALSLLARQLGQLGGSMSNMGIIVQYYTCSSDSSMYNRIPFLYVYIPIRTDIYIYIHIIYTVYTYMCVCEYVVFSARFRHPSI